MTKPRLLPSNGRKADLRAIRRAAPPAPMPAPIEVTRKLSLHQATQTLRVAAEVLIGVDCGDALLNFRVRGLASAVRSVAAELDSILIADDRLCSARDHARDA